MTYHYLSCPACRNKVLDREAIYYDLLYSDLVETDQFTCQTCKFKFEVRRETI